ncbi:hypothetical [Parasynechococcus marenigrum WH 8102]|uniref:Uncharacterized protein n=1 Tax=Parasynechococcus marenigrum (strain WH8102) TaxID=84588 RepID=Q7U941_PARMW|nr:hypothetical [Parasynechococcus marenigrum WH 8102]
MSLAVPMGCVPALQAQTQWQTVEPSTLGTTTVNSWKPVPTTDAPANAQIWEPLSPEEERLEPDQLVWTEPTVDQDASDERGNIAIADEETEGDKSNQEVNEEGFRWPNGQLMSEADQIYYRTAYSRGSMIQIGDTVYPNLGFNALQRHPDSWVNAALIAIDDSRIGPPNCRTGDFLDQCADGMLEARVRLWNSPALSFDLHWTMHSLSGEGSPFNFTIGDQTFGDDDVGTKFGEGQSIGFVLSKNLGQTFGLTFAGYRLFHFDETTDLPRNFALFGTKVFRLNDTMEPPIISVSLGLMSDVFNNETNIGTISYPESLRGGLFPSLFADRYDDKRSGYVYYPDVAGVSSAFVCADRSIFAGKPVSAVDENCIHQVYVGPIASIGFAPWPWFGIYAKYSGTDIDLGVSLKPFKRVPWTISIEALNPIKGVNPTLDQSFDLKECRNRENTTFSDCRTRVGIYTELAF